MPLAVAALAPAVAVEHGSLSRLLLAEHPDLQTALADEGLPAASTTLIPLHPWQVRNVVADRYGPQCAATNSGS